MNFVTHISFRKVRSAVLIQALNVSRLTPHLILTLATRSIIWSPLPENSVVYGVAMEHK